MKLIASLWGIAAILAMLIAFIPLFGWLNWVVIPFAAIGLVISSMSNSKMGKTLCIVVMIFGILRLILGGGIL